ncbi:MAG: hypothetical protein J3K34DRAFT_410013 [Monoraphidium minutum]|nr:MAG: hypothetical protein J3K34DRAFT_410013 [Monoraphidium minutum]
MARGHTASGRERAGRWPGCVCEAGRVATRPGGLATTARRKGANVECAPRGARPPSCRLAVSKAPGGVRRAGARGKWGRRRRRWPGRLAPERSWRRRTRACAPAGVGARAHARRRFECEETQISGIGVVSERPRIQAAAPHTRQCCFHVFEAPLAPWAPCVRQPTRQRRPAHHQPVREAPWPLSPPARRPRRPARRDLKARFISIGSRVAQTGSAAAIRRGAPPLKGERIKRVERGR